MVKIAPNQKNGEGNRPISGAFYPVFLFYGVRRGAKRKKASPGASGGSGWKIAPRNNYMTEVLERRRSWTRYILSRELRKSSDLNAGRKNETNPDYCGASRPMSVV